MIRRLKRQVEKKKFSSKEFILCNFTQQLVRLLAGSVDLDLLVGGAGGEKG